MFAQRKKDTLRRTLCFTGLGCLSVVYYTYTQYHTRSNALIRQQQQMLDRSETLCQVIVPNQATTAFSNDYMAGGAGDYLWNVRCNDSSGQELANLTWNRDTGALQAIGALQNDPVNASSPLLSRKQAVQDAWRWLVATGVASYESRWHATAYPGGIDVPVWNVVWTGTRHHISVKVDGHNGTLVAMFLNNEPSGLKPTAH